MSWNGISWRVEQLLAFHLRIVEFPPDPKEVPERRTTNADLLDDVLNTPTHLEIWKEWQTKWHLKNTVLLYSSWTKRSPPQLIANTVCFVSNSANPTPCFEDSKFRILIRIHREKKPNPTIRKSHPVGHVPMYYITFADHRISNSLICRPILELS